MTFAWFAKGRLVDTALHSMIKETEKAIQPKQYSLVAFLDIVEAFNRGNHRIPTDIRRKRVYSWL